MMSAGVDSTSTVHRTNGGTGRLIAVVGPSGVGKDSFINAMAEAEPEYLVVRRVITRSADSVGEDHQAMTPEAFAQAVRDEAFCLHWHAHNTNYGIPAHVLENVNAGTSCLVNLSRSVLLTADALFANLIVLNLTASDSTLIKRLSQRGRETLAEITGRLERASASVPAGLNVVHISNDGPLTQTVARAREVLSASSVSTSGF